MASVFECGTERRRIAVRDRSDALTPRIHGIDYVEVYVPPPAFAAAFTTQTTLIIVCLKPLPTADFTPLVDVVGGVRVVDPRVLLAVPASQITAATPVLTAAERTALTLLDASARTLVVRVDQAGDFSDYTVSIGWPDTAADVWDPALDEVVVNFKVDCPSPFDCQPVVTCEPEATPDPALDYLNKDYASFRRLMLDRLSTVLPAWTERSPLDLGVTVVEVLAYVADQVSYFQDAAATEAYLGTARRRVSVRRHARLLDYRMHEGHNARAWITIEVASTAAEVTGTEASPAIPLGTSFFSRVSSVGGVVPPEQLSQIVDLYAPVVFQAMEPLPILRRSRSTISFHTWGEDDCCLAAGATRATMLGDQATLNLLAGDVLVFEEVRGRQTGNPADADSTRRWAVRLAKDGEPGNDPVEGVAVVDIEWFAEDALPFPLWVGTAAWGPTREPISVARGNVVLVDHGMTVDPAEIEPAEVPDAGVYRPRVRTLGITFATPYDAATAASRGASAVMSVVPGDAFPAIELEADGETWTTARDLLEAGPNTPSFVVETETGRRSWLRFGDSVMGRAPPAGTRFDVRCRTGVGEAGNVGADSLVHLVSQSLGSAVASVRNPLSAQGGAEPESIEDVRTFAPVAFRTQRRAVTVEDYAGVAMENARVQQAVATLRWTGSWYTMFVTVDPKADDGLEDSLRDELLAAFEARRLAGYDVHLDGPTYVALDVALHICVKPNYLRAAVTQALLVRLGTGRLPDGTIAFFHPDQYSFAQPVYQSALVAAAMEVPGVGWVDVQRFQRWNDRPATTVASDGILRMTRTEVARCDNDPNAQERGLLELDVEGGL